MAFARKYSHLLSLVQETHILPATPIRMNGCYEYGSPSIGRTMTPHLPDFTEETCLNWMNQQLAKARPPLAISILTEPNVRNGVALGLLLETVGQIKLNGLLLQPETRVEHLHNVHELFALMRQINVRLGTIQPENVMNGDKESILQLVQAISNHFKRHPRGRRSVSPHPYSTNSDRATVYQNASTGSKAISKHAINGNCGPHKMHRNHSLIGGHCNGYAQSHGTVVASEEGATKSITALTVMLNGHRARGTIHRSERSYEQPSSPSHASSRVRTMGTASSRTAARCDDLGTPFLCNGGGGTSGGTLASALNRISSERRCLARSGETTKYTKMPDEAHELQSAPPKLTLLRGCDPSNPAPFEVKNGQTYYSFGDTEELQDDRNSRRNQRCFPFSLVELFSGFTKRRDRDHHKHQRLNMHSYGPSGHGEQNGTGILTNGRIPKLELSSSCQSSGFSSYNSTPYSVVSNTHTSFVPPGYAESMKELADLKAQLNALSKLISTDDATLGPDKQSALFPDRGVQTESCHIASTSTEMQQAHEQIARLTRILHEKDIALRQTEQENSRLNELLRSVQTSVRHSGTSSNFSSSESREFHSSCSSSVLPKPQRRRTAMHVFPLDPRNQPCPMPSTDYCRREQVQQYAESREPSLDFTPGTAHHIPDLTTN